MMDQKKKNTTELKKEPEKEKGWVDRAALFRNQMQLAQKRRRRNLILNILLVVFAATFLISGFFLFRYYHESKKNKKLVNGLKEMIVDDAEDTPEETATEGSSEKPKPGEPKYATVNGKKILAKFRKLYEKNPEFVGWLTISGTDVDVPVMYTPEDEQKYLRKNFEGDYALAGTPFIAADCDPEKPTTNLIIYGHNMKDGSMFSDLLKYKDKDFYASNKLIQFDTIYQTGYYEIIAAFPGQVLSVGEEGFRYYSFFDAKSAEEFDTYVKEVKSRTEYDIPTTASYGDQLITLSTCEDYGAEEGKRFVVVAKKVN